MQFSGQRLTILLFDSRFERLYLSIEAVLLGRHPAVFGQLFLAGIFLIIHVKKPCADSAQGFNSSIEVAVTRAAYGISGLTIYRRLFFTGCYDIGNKLPIHTAASRVIAGENDHQFQRRYNKDILPAMSLCKKSCITLCAKGTNPPLIAVIG